MVESIIPLQDALDELCDHIQYMNSGQLKWGTKVKGKNPLENLKLSVAEWGIFESVLLLLQDFINNSNNPAILRWGAALGLTVLEKYYVKTDKTMLYRGAMNLCIGSNRFNASNASTLQAIPVKTLWMDYYKPDNESYGKQKSVINNVRKSRFLDDDDDDIVEASTGDAFKDWIAGDIVASAAARNPILWWTADYIKEDTWCEPLQRMALDSLSCPVTSCDAEHGFSGWGGLMVTKRRYALSSVSIRSAICPSYWAKAPGLIPEGAIIKMFNDKAMGGRQCSQ
ncbi:hypothetical protein V5O48_013002 [Marasmius crinis-equi]|uniref:HAT C-terminal dimerisation domain-containing protein n=1 Tax=Marasmius crinis-equi TaxID=585013 RepID=A0ABR3F193_9AGAR